MSSILSTLFKVQEFELQIDEARQRLGEIEKALNSDKAIQDAKQDVTVANSKLSNASGRTTDLELELASLTEKIQNVNELLYGGSLTNPKELKEREDELASLNRRQENLQFQLTNAKEDLTEAQSMLDEASARLADAESTHATESTSLIEERKVLKEQERDIRKQRKSIVGEVPKPVLNQYRALRKTKGQAVALLNGASCGVCSIEQPSSEVQRIITSDDIILCIGCGRILIGNL